MVSSKATTVASYLDELPPERRAVVATVRELVRRNLPAGYEETMRWGMITWEIPLARYPVTYNGQPLAYAALAAQKNNYALYLMNAHADPVHEDHLRRAYAAAGKRLDMGKSCLRFRRLDELVEGAVAAVIASTGVDDYVARYERARSGRAVGARPLPAKTGGTADPGKTAKAAPATGRVRPAKTAKSGAAAKTAATAKATKPPKSIGRKTSTATKPVGSRSKGGPDKTAATTKPRRAVAKPKKSPNAVRGGKA
jgi:hypothetical protein